MQVYQIISENKQLDEAPVGAVRQGLRRLGAKAAGAIGMSRTASNLRGKADSGAEANQLEKGFNTYLGRQMKSVKQATAQDLARYLKQSGYSIDHMKGMSGVLQSKQIDDVILKSVTNKLAGDKVAGVGGDEPTAAPAPAASGKNKKTASGSSSSASPAPAAVGSGAASPYNQAKAVALKLSAKEKRRLADQLLKSIKQPSTPTP